MSTRSRTQSTTTDRNAAQSASDPEVSAARKPTACPTELSPSGRKRAEPPSELSRHNTQLGHTSKALQQRRPALLSACSRRSWNRTIGEHKRTFFMPATPTRRAGPIGRHRPRDGANGHGPSRSSARKRPFKIKPSTGVAHGQE